MLLVVAATELELARLDAVEALCCGVGPVDAAASTAKALAERTVDAVLHIGLAGAHRIEPPALVLGAESIYCDVVDTRSSFPRVERVLPDPSLLEAARRAVPEALVLPIGTSGRIGGGEGCEVEAMEGFGVLRAAALAGVPAVELRAVSNAVDEPDRGAWRFDEALDLLADAVPRILEELVRA